MEYNLCLIKKLITQLEFVKIFKFACNLNKKQVQQYKTNLVFPLLDIKHLKLFRPYQQEIQRDESDASRLKYYSLSVPYFQTSGDGDVGEHSAGATKDKHGLFLPKHRQQRSLQLPQPDGGVRQTPGEDHHHPRLCSRPPEQTGGSCDVYLSYT